LTFSINFHGTGWALFGFHDVKCYESYGRNHFQNLPSNVVGFGSTGRVSFSEVSALTGFAFAGFCDFTFSW
jgi:hypothetical protein